MLVDVDKIEKRQTTNNKGMAMNATLNSSSLEYHQPCRGLSRTRSTDTLRRGTNAVRTMVDVEEYIQT